MILGAAAYFLTAEPDYEYASLYNGLDRKTASQIVDTLAKQNVPYKLADGGKVVMVPRDRVDELRLQIAGAGIAIGDGLAEEQVEESPLATRFVQKQHARLRLERRLSRTIGALNQVESARVHIAEGQDSIFKRSRTPPRATVVLKLRPGQEVSTKEAQAIKHIVAGSVPRLPVTAVTVVDTAGRTIGPAAEQGEDAASARAIAIIQEMESRMENRVVRLLEPVVGVGHVVARVTIDRDTSRTEETAEEYDPENSTVRSEQKSDENNRSRRNSGGAIAGTQGNIPQGSKGAQPGSSANSQGSRSSTKIDYAVPRVVRHTQRSLGDVRRLSIAVLVDSSNFQKPGEAAPVEEPPKDKAVPTDDVEKQPVKEALRPRPNDEALAALVKNAVGFDTMRGDQMTLSFQPFNHTDVPELGPEAYAEPGLKVPSWLPLSLVTLIGFVLIFSAMRSTEKRRRAEAEAKAKAEAEERERERKAAEAAEEDPVNALKEPTPGGLREEIKAIAETNVPATLEIMKQWLSTQAGRE